MTIFDWCFQLFLNKFEKGGIYNANFEFKDNYSNEIHVREHLFRALSIEQAQRIKIKLEAYYKRALSSKGAAREFGLKHSDNGFFLNNLQRISGTRNLKTNFRKGLMPGDVPMFAFTRYSYNVVSDGIKKVTRPKHQESNQKQQITAEEVKIIKFRLLCTFGLGTGILASCLILFIYSLSNGHIWSLQSYSSISIFVISLLTCIACTKQYKGLNNG
ncbi:hypothetical protein HHX48_17790 [Salinimonas sp. HHU 13199]|uniref:Uncharacterized protein n=1 Tax=Salinimonas profundi TaxID=2729140 RepID=A0ABR8LN24_9ALTE|nr:hypothetical protein [Salinimonas profundi]MBD3587594.1 hypothetical protein [Salinimonas profundi]